MFYTIYCYILFTVSYSITLYHTILGRSTTEGAPINPMTYRFFYFGCLNRVSKPVQARFSCIESVMLLTLRYPILSTINYIPYIIYYMFYSIY